MDLGPGFGTWIWDLDLGLDLGLTIIIITQFHSKIFIPVLDNVEATRGEAGPERLQGEELV